MTDPKNSPDKLKLILIALLALPIIFLYLVLNIPIYIYRWVICHLVAPFYRPEIGNIVSGLSLAFALEFYNGKKRSPSTPSSFKSTIVVKCILEETVPFDELLEAIESRVLNKPHPSGNGLMYPELQQYPTPWMGFMFWKREKSFNLNNHVHLHKIDETGDDSDSERYVEGMMEKLVNKRYPPEKSPWEVHAIHNYRNGQLSTKPGAKMTAFIFCVHHSIADGYSIVNLLVNDICKLTSSDAKLVKPSLPPAPRSHTVMEKLLAPIRLSIQILSDFGYVLWIRKLGERTSWHVDPEEKANQTMMMSRSKLIPMHLVKDVKNKFGVTFTAVLFSILSKGISESLKKLGTKPKRFTMAVVLPLPNHPKELTNHATSAYLDANLNLELSSQERLHLAESSLAEQKNSLLRPIIVALLIKLLSYQIASIGKKILTNRAIPTGITNFPSPVGNLQFNGRKVVHTDFATGTLPGVAGVVFALSSSNDKIRIRATAETGVMSKNQLDDLIEVICGELQELHQQSLAVSVSTSK